MKRFVITWLALWVGACGDGGQGSRDFPAGAQPPAANQSQTPQRPSDTVPPLSSQAPATNSQQPPSGTQSAGPSAICAQLATALQSAGCKVSDTYATDCQSATDASYPCLQQVEALIACLLPNVVCTTEGALANTVCPSQRDALEACIKGAAPPPGGPRCKSATNCQDCADACASCRCSVETSPDLAAACDTIC